VNRDTFVSNAYLTAVGKIPTFVAGDKKYEKLVALANMKIDEWAREADWFSLYDKKYQLGTISTTDTYDLDDEIEQISTAPGDFVRVERTDGETVYFETVRPDQLRQYLTGNFCAKIGRTLVFNKEFESDDLLIGGTIYLPVKLYPEKLTSAGSTVPVDDPNWLVKITAAEWVRNDSVRQNQYPNLIAEANSLMEKMKEANDGSQVSDVLIDMPSLGRSW